MQPLLQHVALVGSTNDEVAARIRANCPHGAAIVADEQTAGRGRRGRQWSAPAGRNLTMSVAIVGPRHAPTMLLLPIAAAVAAADELARAAGVPVELKWPNDLLVGGKKLGGILCEAVLEGSRFLGAVIGLGVNVNSPLDELDPELAATATSLFAETGQTRDVIDLAARIRLAIADDADRLAAGDAAAIVDAWRARDATTGRRVSGDGFVGTASGVADDGALIVLTDDGQRLEVRSGEVLFATARDPAR